MLNVITGLLIVVFLLFLSGALKVASETDKKIERSRSEENQNETGK